jgi:hypothetical protein
MSRSSWMLGASCALLLGCPVPTSESKAVSTPSFPKTWDQLEQEAPPETVTQGAARAPEATGPVKPVDVLELTDGTELVGIITQQAPGQFVVLVTAAGEQHTVPWARIRTGVGASTLAATAPPTPPPPPPPPPPQAKRGVVVLKDGTKVAGILERVEPGQYVIVQTADGGERTISWDRVSEVNVAPADAGTPK